MGKGENPVMAPYVVVGIDRSRNSRRALAWAIREGQLRNAPVLVVHVWRRPRFGIRGRHAMSGRDRAERFLEERAAAAVAGTGLPPMLVLSAIEGDAAAALTKAADHASLLVLASAHDHAGRKRIGRTVAGRVVCPVVIVRGTVAQRYEPAQRLTAAPAAD